MSEHDEVMNHLTILTNQIFDIQSKINNVLIAHQIPLSELNNVFDHFTNENKSRIETVKAIRQATNCGLTEALAFYDKWFEVV